MKSSATPRLKGRNRRHMRIRKKVTGTAERPRLAVYRSLNHIYAQLVDDLGGRTIMTVSSLDKEVVPKGGSTKGKIEAGKLVGNGRLPQRHREHALLRCLARLADGIGDFIRLAEAHADAPLAVSDRHDRVEAEPAPALHHLGDAIHVDHALDELGVLLGLHASAHSWVSHEFS